MSRPGSPWTVRNIGRSIQFGGVYVGVHPYYAGIEDCHLHSTLDTFKHKPLSYKVFGSLTYEADFAPKSFGGSWRGENGLAISWVGPMGSGNEYWNLAFRGKSFLLAGIPPNTMGLKAASILQTSPGTYKILTIWDNTLRVWVLTDLDNPVVPLGSQITFSGVYTNVEFCSDALGAFGVTSRTIFGGYGDDTVLDYLRVADNLEVVSKTSLLQYTNARRDSAFTEDEHGNPIFEGDVYPGEHIQSFCVEGRSITVTVCKYDSIDLSITSNTSVEFTDPAYQSSGGAPVSVIGYRVDLACSHEASGHIEVIRLYPLYPGHSEEYPNVPPMGWNQVTIDELLEGFSKSLSGTRTHYLGGWGDGGPDPSLYTNPPPWGPSNPGVEYVTRVAPEPSETLSISGSEAHATCLSSNAASNHISYVILKAPQAQSATWVDDYSSLVSNAEFYQFPYSYENVELRVRAKFGATEITKYMGTPSVNDMTMANKDFVFGAENGRCFIANSYTAINPTAIPVSIKIWYSGGELSVLNAHYGHAIGLTN